MPASILAKAVMVLVMMTSFSPSAASLRYTDIIGTTSTWDVDANLDGIIDGFVHVDDVVSISDPVVDASDLRCTLTWENISAGTEVSINNVSLSWMSIPLVASTLVDPGELFADYFAGVNREFIPVTIVIDDEEWVLACDKLTGFTLGMYRDNGTTILGPKRVYYMRLSFTTVYFSPVQVAPYMPVLAIVITSIAVVYTVAVTARDKNLRKSRACFRDGCW